MNPTSSHSEWLGKNFLPPAERIVSLVPSLTEAVFMLDAGNQLAGRTEFCVRPADGVRGLPTIGGTKNPDIEMIRSLSPDLILANREENTKEHVTSLAKNFPVLLTDPHGPEDVPALWMELGAITGQSEKARARADEVLSTHALIRLERLYPNEKPPHFIYFVWKNPWIAAGHDTYISNMLAAAGFQNALPPERARFPKLAEKEILPIDADVHFYSSEPFPFVLPKDLLISPGTQPRPIPGGFLVHNGILALGIDAEPLSWYPSQTAAGLRYAARLYDIVVRSS